MRSGNQRIRLVRNMTFYQFLVSISLFFMISVLSMGVISSFPKILGMAVTLSLAGHCLVAIAWSMKIRFQDQKIWLLTLYKAQAARFMMVAILTATIFYRFEEMRSPQLAGEFLLVFLLAYILPTVLLNIRFSEFNWVRSEYD